ncbi:zinc finger BED domain-containing protein 6 [Xenopus laevis]|uniref:Zinc finger BED domain-containing protein 6 n=2 Tax=Xenopus laevis TaxID=8355 RepID=A0A1L8FPJ5_XENLA|nr:zinc finger BED domain-containing protein 6 [Xenopus laevis]XP_018082083.1 zinc finger BED domain-containing protein 6 [Xenopus laevis]XP_041425751.1 zinc finger BED domain-containing protein 6 [Xenopus laevis]OCT73502.1 hypothetical protein XELAEV_18036479mg [Xenopus laevis]
MDADLVGGYSESTGSSQVSTSSGIKVEEVDADGALDPYSGSIHGDGGTKQVAQVDISTPLVLAEVVSSPFRGTQGRSAVWDFFEIPPGHTAGNSVVVICKICGALVRRGSPGCRLGTTCLFNHLSRVHGKHLHRGPAANQALLPQNSNSLTSPADGSRVTGSSTSAHAWSREVSSTEMMLMNRRSNRQQTRKTFVPVPLRHQPHAPCRRQEVNQGIKESRDRSGSRFSAHQRALMARLYSDVLIHCDLCHVLLSSGERDQHVRDTIIMTHMRSQHPQRFCRLEREAARDLLRGDLVLCSTEHNPNCDAGGPID